jgi:hypothetical protein
MQRKWVEDMGFKPLLDMRCTRVERELCRWLMNRFDHKTRELEIRPGNRIRIYDNHVGWVMGIPRMRNKDVKTMKNEERLRVLREFYRNDNGMSATTVGDMMVACTDELQFKQHFILFTLGTLLCPTQSFKISPFHLKVVGDPTNLTNAFNLNWAQFVLDWLVSYAKKYNVAMSTSSSNLGGSGIGGCVIFLQV